MKIRYSLLSLALGTIVSLQSSAQAAHATTTNDRKLFIDVHQMGPGKVKFEDVSGAHAKDLAVEKKHDVHFINYWVDEAQGLIYCLSSAADSTAVRETHAEAHGL